MIEVDTKVASSVKLPRTLILYTVDADHFVLSVKPLESLEEAALTKTRVSVAVQQDKYLIKLPAKIYNFYQWMKAITQLWHRIKTLLRS